MRASVYFARAESGGGPIKIGHSRRAAGRVAEMRTDAGERCVMLASLPGELQVEKRCHALFIEDLLYGEWFHPSPTLLATIDKINRGQFTEDDLPKFRPIPRHVRERARPAPSLSKVPTETLVMELLERGFAVVSTKAAA